MTPNLFEATRKYWRQLNELEAAYQRNEVSLNEVDARVEALMQELGRARRESLRIAWMGIQSFVQEQRETLAGAAAIGILAYVWLALNGLNAG